MLQSACHSQDKGKLCIDAIKWRWPTCWSFTGDRKGQGGQTQPGVVVLTEPAALRRQLGPNGSQVLANAQGGSGDGLFGLNGWRRGRHLGSQCGKKKAGIACHIALAYDWIPNRLNKISSKSSSRDGARYLEARNKASIDSRIISLCACPKTFSTGKH